MYEQFNFKYAIFLSEQEPPLTNTTQNLWLYMKTTHVEIRFRFHRKPTVDIDDRSNKILNLVTIIVDTK